MKNKDKWKLLADEIKTHEQRLLAAFLLGKQRPTVLWVGVTLQEWTVTDVYSSQESVWDEPQPTNMQLTRLQEKRDRIAALTEADPMKVFISLKNNTATTGLPWARLADHSYGYYDVKEEAEVFSKKWHADHDPRPGHQPCDYCGKQVADASIFRATIWRNGGQEQRKFCNGTCASHDQMASEG